MKIYSVIRNWDYGVNGKTEIVDSFFDQGVANDLAIDFRARFTPSYAVVPSHANGDTRSDVKIKIAIFETFLESLTIEQWMDLHDPVNEIREKLNSKAEV